MVSSVDLILLPSDSVKRLLLLDMQSGNQFINSAGTSFSLIEVSAINPCAIGINLRSVVFLNVEHVGVVDILFNLPVLQLHLVNIFSHLVHSPS